MKDEDFQGLVRGLEDAIAFVKGDAARGRIAVGPDVRAIRQLTRKTQGQFAATFQLPIGTVRDWEQGRRQPDAPARILLKMIAVDPEAVERIVERVEA
jgi:putative transcriptional regulator